MNSPPEPRFTGRDVPTGQAQLLATIQNTSAKIAEGIDKSFQAIWDPRAKQAHDLRRVRWITEEIAASIGVPAEWTAHARTAGDRGVRWRVSQRLPAPGPIDRDRLVDGLTDQARRLQAMAAVSAGYTHRFGEPSPAELARVQHRMTMQWERVGAVAHALDVTATERDRMWPTDTANWHRIVATVRAQGAMTLAATWHQMAAPANPQIVRLPVTALRLAQIDVRTVAPENLPPPPEQLLALAEAATQALERTGADHHGAAIEAAIEASATDLPTLIDAMDAANTESACDELTIPTPVAGDGIEL
ncbi:hypothetical protein ACQPW1_22440 [Nocardia sp. CA-128927]|uniref:hypothetical protein n=1 Tax=Nocardia sp. CA-128927 TaxID=3239975 RepID=UPI003D96492E